MYKIKKMKKTLLFAIDSSKEEVIISESSKSNKIYFIERISKNENTSLYFAVFTLTQIANSDYFDEKIFLTQDKVCQMIYESESILKDSE